MISFVVLHYKNINDTIECLDNIYKISRNDESSIIVVDNGTLDESNTNRIKKYTKDIIHLNENIGFAKANNIGVSYALKKYLSTLVCVLNNDVFITQKNFIDILIKDYKKYEFDLLGPKINSITNESVNPFPVFKDKNSVCKEIKKCKKLIKIYSSPILFKILIIYIKIKAKFIRKQKNNNGIKLEKNVPLHGCCIVFSKQYFKKYDTAFDPCTFLFHEEEFLYQRIIKSNLISIYEPNLNVFHKEGSSMKMGNIRKQKLFKEKEKLKSLTKLLIQM
jgi:GT2 family glycosyltransferase